MPGAGTRNSKQNKEIEDPHTHSIRADEAGACLPQRTMIVLIDALNSATRVLDDPSIRLKLVDAGDNLDFYSL